MVRKHWSKEIIKSNEYDVWENILENWEVKNILRSIKCIKQCIKLKYAQKKSKNRYRMEDFEVLKDNVCILGV